MNDEGHRKLQIYQEAHRLAIEIHNLTLNLPSFERFEEGSQIRRSAKSVAANIVEGYALRKYKNEFVHFLFRAYGSCEETVEHLNLLYETKSFTDKDLYNRLRNACDILCGKILRYIQAIDQTFEAPNFMKEPDISYIVSEPKNGNSKTTVTRNQKPVTSKPFPNRKKR